MKTRFVTPPVEVMTTTMSTCGWSARTSTWRIVAVSTGGAETIASRFVTCESVSVVARIASSTSRRTSWSSRPAVAAGQLAAVPGAEQAVDVEAVARVGRHAPRARVRMGEQPVLLEHRELVADRRRAGRDLGIGGERLRARRAAPVAV